MEMQIQLSEKHVDLFNSWLNLCSNPNLDARYTGVHAGIEYVLQVFNVYENVTHDKAPVVFTVSQDVVNQVVDKCNKNSIEALWNLGVASGISWVLDELNIPKEVK